VNDPHREVPTPLDTRLGVNEMDVLPFDPVDRLSRLELDDDSCREREDRAD
jgi:hypothetical protein